MFKGQSHEIEMGYRCMDEYIILEYELPVLWHIFVKGLPIPSDNLQQSISYPLEQFAKAFP